jgi:multicomponent Na+:H+ antiporter subunit F
MYIFWVVLFFILLFVFKAIKGPTIWDRLLCMSLISVKLIVLIIAYASMLNKSYMLDYAIICALFGFISIIFISLFILDRERGRKR